MEQRLLKFLLIQLKIAAGLLLISLLSILLFSFSSRKFADDLWAQLGISKSQGTENISASFLQGYFNYYGARNAKNIAVGNRAQVVKDLGTYARQYVNSEEFRTAYKNNRESMKPELPAKAKTETDIRDEQKKVIQESINSLEEFLKGSNADLKKMAREGLPAMRQQLKDLSDPKNPTIKYLAEGEKMVYDQNMEKYRQDLANYEKEQPADPKQLIKARLKEFLEVTADIDFNAELKEKYGKKRFVNPAYESKPADWKMAFRAGKETVSAARAFAQEWLKEL